MGTRWTGLIVPINRPTGDGRRMAPGSITHRELPLPLKWQRSDEQGHDDSVVIGRTDAIRIDEAAGEVWAEGELFDDVSPTRNPRLAEDVAEAKFLLEKKSIGPSVDAGAARGMLVLEGTDIRPEDVPMEMWVIDEEPELETLFTHYEIAAATLVPIPAYAECRPFELIDENAQASLTAAVVRRTGWDDMPLAARDREWDSDAAKARVSDHCGVDGDSPDWGCYERAFLYRDEEDDPETKGAYSFPIVDVVDGEMHVVPRGVFTAAAVLEGSMGGTDIPEAAQDDMRAVISGIYERMAREFDDPDIVAPWEADRMSVLAAMTTLQTPPLAESLFADPQLEGYTHLTVRELEGGWREIFGHMADHRTCHRGVRDMCLTAPYGTDYAAFHRYQHTEGGTPLPVAAGRLTAGHGQHASGCRCCPVNNDDHACRNLSYGATIAHHDRMRTVGYVCAGEDERNNAIWFHGVVPPEVDDADLALLARQKVSGDWRDVRAEMELTEILLLAREQPGFPLPAGASRNGRQLSLTAAGAVLPPAEMPEQRPALERNSDQFAARVADMVAERLNPRPSAGSPVCGSGWDDFTLAPREHPWLNRDARARLAMASRIDHSDADWDHFARAFLHRDTQGAAERGSAYGFPILDVVDGRRQIVPAAVMAAAERLASDEGSKIDPAHQEKLRTVLSALYRRMADEFGDPSLITPWQHSALTAAAQHTGAMVALRMTEADAARLAVTDGEPIEELHLTLCYLGSADQISAQAQEQVVERMRGVARDLGSVPGDAFAVSAFNPGTSNDRDTALVLGVGGEQIPSVQDEVLVTLAEIADLEIPDQHVPFVPHVTLAYSDDLARVRAMVDRVGPLSFDRLRVAFAGRATDIPLGDGRSVSAEQVGVAAEQLGRLSALGRARQLDQARSALALIGG